MSCCCLTERKQCVEIWDGASWVSTPVFGVYALQGAETYLLRVEQLNGDVVVAAADPLAPNVGEYRAADCPAEQFRTERMDCVEVWDGVEWVLYQGFAVRDLATTPSTFLHMESRRGVELVLAGVTPNVGEYRLASGCDCDTPEVP